MKRAVVSFADSGNHGVYQSKLRRLETSLKGNFDGDFLGFTDYKQIDSPTHKEIPYAFKPYAIQKAIDLGYESVLWADSPVHAIKSIQPVFEYIEEHGYLMFDNIGHPLGKWTNDKCLEYFDYTREECMDIKMIMACCMGFDFTNEGTKYIFGLYKELAKDLYPGSWEIHRHDQTVMSFLLEEYAMDIVTAHKTFFIYEAFRSVPQFKIADSVCLVSQ